jgi:hypothetical protein
MSSYKRIDESTQMGMELQKMSRGHAKCDNGTWGGGGGPKENKAYERLCQKQAVLPS